MRRLLVPLLFLLTCLTTACITLTDPEASQIHHQDVIATLNGSEDIVFSQTFVSRRSGLNSITFWASRDKAELSDQGFLMVEIHHDPPSEQAIYRSLISVSSISQNTPLRIEFPPVENPPYQSYRISLKAQNSVLLIHGRNENIYPFGGALISSTAIPGDMAFTSTYRYQWQSLLEDFQSLIPFTRLIITIFVLLVLPGWFLLIIFGLHREFDPWENLALSCGLSLAVLPIIMVWTTQLDLRWNQIGILLILSVSALIFLWQMTRAKYHLSISHLSLIDFLMFFSITLVLISRLVMIRDMSAPAWVDSIHHVWIARLITEQGGFPEVFSPYLSSNVTSYHLGFHTMLAAIHMLSGIDLSTSLLYFGQALNVASVLGVYLLTTSLTGDRRAGLVAFLAAGLFSPMPAYYTSWGRYTHLAGLVILPVATAFLVHHLASKSTVRRMLFLGITALATGGLFLVHYRIAGFLAFLFFLILSHQIISGSKPISHRLGFAIFAAVCIGALSAIITLPWLLRTLKDTIIPFINLPINVSPWFNGFSWRYLDSALGQYPLFFAYLGLGLAIFLRHRIGGILLNWVILMFLLANLNSLGLPGGNLVNNHTVAITLFLPISLLTGFFFSRIIQLANRFVPITLRPWGKWSLVVVFCIAALIGFQQIIPILNPDTILTRQADMKAISWSREHLPENASVMLNPFLWGYNVYAGADGGYWITALSGQPSIPPPVIQNPANWEAFPAVNAISEQAIKIADNPLLLHGLLKTHNIKYLFIGARGGIFSPQKLAQSELFRPVYAADGVWIFMLTP